MHHVGSPILWAHGGKDVATRPVVRTTTGEAQRKLLIAQIHNERGVCRYKLVCFDQAVQDYTQALALNPALAAAYYHRATIHYRLLAGHPKGSSRKQALGQQAMQDFKEAVRRDPNNIEFKEGLQSCRDEIEAVLNRGSSKFQE
ncbi:Tetratricopeptide repeat protein 32 [Chionoecetes opilio]|uniref:Tetratricopeptide repeat protein 32 n=1 Tax=Chionoecetes opilio TaxID=41210 RepID=A0A8J4YKX2_CHIOP|nr:Tetratricopeptide repeat protein 32 [Chionoecetes opilio]